MIDFGGGDGHNLAGVKIRPNDSSGEVLLAQAVSALGARYGVLFSEDGGELLPLACWGLERPEESHAALARRALAQAKPMASGAGGSPEELLMLGIPLDWTASSRGALILAFPPDEEGLARSLPLVAMLTQLIRGKIALQEELSQKEEQVRELIKSTLEAQETERESICLEVHDGVAQTLVSALHFLESLEEVYPKAAPGGEFLLRASGLVRQAIQESRELVNSLQPTTLRDLGLIATLRQEMRQLEAETGWKVELMADAVRLPKEMEVGLYRIIREAVTNARKHSATSRIRVQLKQQDGRILVEVKDWGVGFTSFVEKRKSPGLGFHSMRRRASLWGGSCSIDSAPGQGTTVRVEIPTGEGK